LSLTSYRTTPITVKKQVFANFQLFKVVFPEGCLSWRPSSLFQNFENSFELYWIIPTIVTKQVELIPASCSSGRASEGIKTKVNSALTEAGLGNINAVDEGKTSSPDIISGLVQIRIFQLEFFKMGLSWECYFTFASQAIPPTLVPPFTNLNDFIQYIQGGF
jgi:hypothetical protein